MEKSIDLHIHSNFSEDADLTVKEIFETARDLSIHAISITDHDSVESIEASRSIEKKYPVEYIPGVEITTVLPTDGSQQHILGYFVNDKNSALLATLKDIKRYRVLIAKARIDALRNIGFNLDEDRIFRMNRGRPPAATSIMLEIFHNDKNSSDKRLYDYLYGEKKENRIRHFYQDYLVEDKPAYVPFQSISVEEGIDIIKRARGIPVLAHPKFLKKRELLNTIKDLGIQGIEAISTYHNEEDVEFYLSYALKNGLLITSGSDYHGPTSKPNINLATQHRKDDLSYLKDLKDFHNTNK